MWLSIDLDMLSDLIEQTQFEFQVWCWTMALMWAFAIVMVMIDARKRRRRDVMHYRRLPNNDPRWGYRR